MADTIHTCWIIIWLWIILRFWHSLVLQKENTGTHKEKGQQSMSKRLLVLNYIHYRTLSQKATKKLSHSLREDGRRAHHVCLKCKLFQVKEDLCLLLDPKHTAPVLQKAKQSVVTINWKHNRRSCMRQKQHCQFSQQRSSLQASTKDMIWLNTLQYI